MGTKSEYMCNIQTSPDTNYLTQHTLTFDLIEKPPVSYTMPLPAQQIVSLAPRGVWLSTARAGWCTAALPTP